MRFVSKLLKASVPHSPGSVFAIKQTRSFSAAQSWWRFCYLKRHIHVCLGLSWASLPDNLNCMVACTSFGVSATHHDSQVLFFTIVVADDKN